MFRAIPSSIIRSIFRLITTSGTGRTVFATVRWRGVVVPSPPRQRTVANTVRPVPDVVITVWICSWWCMCVSSETCRAVCRKYNRTTYSHILLDSYCHWFTMHGPLNITQLCYLTRCSSVSKAVAVAVSDVQGFRRVTSGLSWRRLEFDASPVHMAVSWTG